MISLTLVAAAPLVGCSGADSAASLPETSPDATTNDDASRDAAAGADTSPDVAADAAPDASAPDAEDADADAPIEADLDALDASAEGDADVEDAASDGASHGCEAGCDDGIACTRDTCEADVCAHAPLATWEPGACAAGTYCELGSGCVQSPVCSTDAQCQQAFASDACKVDVRCDKATALCVFATLDSDGDHHAPLACGGDDCNDANADVHPGSSEACDGIDDDCDGTIDVGASCGGAMACCAGACVDGATDRANCGACGHACAGTERCESAECVDVCGGGTVCLACADPDACSVCEAAANPAGAYDLGAWFIEACACTAGAKCTAACAGAFDCGSVDPGALVPAACADCLNDGVSGADACAKAYVSRCQSDAACFAYANALLACEAAPVTISDAGADAPSDAVVDATDDGADDAACIPACKCAVEVCNGLDDNCNGMVDEADPGGGAACDTGLAGVCAAGLEHCCTKAFTQTGTACTLGTVACVATNKPKTETCNGLDDDCDGVVDNVKPGGAACSPEGSDAAGTLECCTAAKQQAGYDCSLGATFCAVGP